MKKKLRNCIALFFCLMMILAIPCMANTIKISLNGQVLNTQVAPVNKQGTILVPLRLISENLGATVDYNGSTKTITIIESNTTLKLYIGSKSASINGSTITLAASPELVHQTTIVPLRFISEQLNCSVDWNSSKQIVSIISKTHTMPNTTDTNTGHPIATMVIKDYGTVTLELYPDMAPNTVTNFMVLANNGFYDSLTFHRVIDNFMIQGGDPLGNGSGGPNYSIGGEFASNGFTQNTLSHTKGILSMARTYDPNSAGSQFFITSADSTYLDGEYAAFGKVISGMSIVETIAKVDTDSKDCPLTAIVIQSIRVKANGYTPQTLNLIH